MGTFGAILGGVIWSLPHGHAGASLSKRTSDLPLLWWKVQNKPNFCGLRRLQNSGDRSVDGQGRARELHSSDGTTVAHMTFGSACETAKDNESALMN